MLAARGFAGTTAVGAGAGVLVATASPAAAAPGRTGSPAAGWATSPAPRRAALAVIPRLRVTPASGRATTVFTIHFDARQPSGRSNGFMYAYTLNAAPQRPARGCATAVTFAPRATAAGQSLAVKLVPSRFGRHWCKGTYTGEVGETVGPGCGPVTDGPVACPMYMVLERIGTFRFTVKG
jgi:hypothetical protein